MRGEARNSTLLVSLACEQAKRLSAGPSRHDAAQERVKAPLELISAQSAIDGNDRTRDVARHRRGEEQGERGEIRGLAPIAHRNLFLGKMLAIIFGIVAADLFTHDSAGRNAIDRDAVLSHLARQSLRPSMNRSLRCKCRIESLRFGFAGYIDDASPAAFNHLRQ